MPKTQLPPLILKDWRETRDTLQKYAQMISAIREKMSIPHPHWWHISLRVSDRGLTTTPIPKDKNTPGQTFEIILDLKNHHLIIESNFREAKRIKLTGQSLCALCEETCSLLTDIGVVLPIDKEKFADGKSGKYDENAATDYWTALKEINRITNKFRSELSGERSPVQLWSHHFDLSMSWFSGRLVPGKDPDDAESSKEQMMFGFSTGDDTITDAYFYITAYPLPEGLSNLKTPKDSRWNSKGFQGEIMMYDSFANSENPEEKLLNYFRTFHKAGAELMR
ncbi:MAG: hypothetical protein IH784_00260 [Bacteroidetes bacterium]|nr:hypothetical protein [Bacteroidota bacterium]